MAKLFMVVSVVDMHVLANDSTEASEKVEKYLRERIRKSCHGRPTRIRAGVADQIEEETPVEKYLAEQKKEESIEYWYLGVMHADSVSVLRFKTEKELDARLVELIKLHICTCQITEESPLLELAEEEFKDPDCTNVCVTFEEEE